MTSYEVWLDSGENLTVEADEVDRGALYVNFLKSGNLTALIPLSNVKMIRIKSVNYPK